MECPECNREMKVMPYMLTSNPPQDEYRCECGHIKRVTIGELSNPTIWGIDLSNSHDITIINGETGNQEHIEKIVKSIHNSLGISKDLMNYE